MPFAGCPGVSWHCQSTVPGKCCSVDNGPVVSPVFPSPTAWEGKSGGGGYFQHTSSLGNKEALVGRERNRPAVYLGLDTTPAVTQLTHHLRVLGQVHVTLVEGLRDLTVPVQRVSQVRLQSGQQVSFLIQLAFHLLKHKVYDEIQKQEGRTCVSCLGDKPSACSGSLPPLSDLESWFPSLSNAPR